MEEDDDEVGDDDGGDDDDDDDVYKNVHFIHYSVTCLVCNIVRI